MHNIAPCKESRFWNPANFFLWNPESWKICLWKYPESWDLESRNIQLKGSLMMGIQSSSCKLESIAWNPESIAWNSESKTVFDFLTRANNLVTVRRLCGNLTHRLFLTETKLIQEKDQLATKRLQNSKSQQVKTARQSKAKEKPAPHRRHHCRHYHHHTFIFPFENEPDLETIFM